MMGMSFFLTTTRIPRIQFMQSDVETSSIGARGGGVGHGRKTSISSTLRSRMSFSKKRMSTLSVNTTNGQQTDRRSDEKENERNGTEYNSFAARQNGSGSKQASPHARHFRTPSKPQVNSNGIESASSPASPPEVPSKSPVPSTTSNPVITELSRIPHFLVAACMLSIIATRFLHWTIALVLSAVIAYVLRTQLRIAAQDSAWLEREQQRQLNTSSSNAKGETVEWMNAVLKTVWPLINQEYFVPFIDLLEDALMQQVPGIVHSCRVEDLDQGTVPLHVQSFTLLDADQTAFIGSEGDSASEHGIDVKQKDEGLDEAREDDNSHPLDVGEFVNLEITFAYRSPAARRKKAKSNKVEGVISDADREAIQSMDSDLPVDQIHMLIYMAIGLQKIAAVEVPVWCEVLGIEGKMRLRIQLVPTAPFVGHVAFTFVGKPKLEISAKPLGRRMVIDAMHLPLISSYVLYSVESVIKNFITPKSYTVDVASLLEAQDGPRNVYSLGVIVLVIHQGIDLPAADKNGKSDPFVSVSFARAGRPLFTSRVLLKTRDPIWQEMAVLPVSPDEIHDREKLRITVFDADRFSIDDPLGKVEMSIDRLIHRALLHENDPNSASLFETQTEDLKPMTSGKKTQGRLSYSVGFFRLVKPQQGGRTASKVQLLREAAGRHVETPTSGGGESGSKSLPLPPETPSSPGGTSSEDKRGEDDSDAYMTGFDRFVRSIGLPLDPNVLEQRRKRKERVAKLTTMMEGEAQATFGPPDKRWPSGILLFHIHAITGLGFEGPQRSWTNSKRLARKPQYTADEDVLDEGTSKMPNSYVQVLLNDEPIFRTRTKTLNPQPFINAGSERWVSNFDAARIDFVVRDARQRENDAILGIAPIKLDEHLVDSCRVTDWYTLSGGLGYGKIRISLLWRSCEVQIPPRLRGWNVGVLEIASCYIGGMSSDQKATFDKREANLLFETVGGRTQTDNVEPHWESELDDGDGEGTIGFNWPILSPVRIAVRQRYPNFAYIHLQSDSRVPGRTHKYAHTVVPLHRVEDGKMTRKRVPLFEAMEWQRFEQNVLRDMTKSEQLASDTAGGRKRLPILDDLVSDVQEETKQDNDDGTKKGRESTDSRSTSLRQIGYLDVTLIFHPGLAPEHRSLVGGDHELRVAFESFQTLVDAGLRARPKMLSATRKRKLSTVAGKGRASLERASVEEKRDIVDVDSTSERAGRPSSLRIATDVEGANGQAYEQDDEDDESDGLTDDEEGLVDANNPEGRRARMRNLHRQQRGAAQIKSFRTLQWLKTNAEDGVGRVKRIASRQQDKRIAKMESEGVSHF